MGNFGTEIYEWEVDVGDVAGVDRGIILECIFKKKCQLTLKRHII
jgi:hypothetical protein